MILDKGPGFWSDYIASTSTFLSSLLLIETRQTRHPSIFLHY
jgi:hypothetical protein